MNDVANTKKMLFKKYENDQKILNFKIKPFTREYLKLEKIEQISEDSEIEESKCLSDRITKEKKALMKNQNQHYYRKKIDIENPKKMHFIFEILIYKIEKVSEVSIGRVRDMTRIDWLFGDSQGIL